MLILFITTPPPRYRGYRTIFSLHSNIITTTTCANRLKQPIFSGGAQVPSRNDINSKKTMEVMPPHAPQSALHYYTLSTHKCEMSKNMC